MIETPHLGPELRKTFKNLYTLLNEFMDFFSKRKSKIRVVGM